VRCDQGRIHDLTQWKCNPDNPHLELGTSASMTKSHDEIQHLDKPSNLVSKGCLKIVRPAYNPIQLDVHCTASMSNAFERNHPHKILTRNYIPSGE